MDKSIKAIIKPFYRLLQSGLIYGYRTATSPTDYEINITNFINSNNYSSTTNYFIYVDLDNFKTNIFKGSKGSYKLIKSYLCTIGKPSTPTPRGIFYTGVKGLFFGTNRGYKCWYYTQFQGNYLFHTIVYNLDGTVRDGRLGMALSNGCVRLSKENAKWIWDTIPKNTTVLIK